MNPFPTRIGESISNFLSRVGKQKEPEKQALLDSLLEALTATPPKTCYYCPMKNFRSKEHYQKHILHSHTSKPAYPNLPYLRAMNLQPQGCLWEE